MKLITRVAPVVLLAACGGAQNMFSSVTQARMVDTVDCAADAIGDEGFRVTDRNNEAGLLRASYAGLDDAADGGVWLDMRVVPDGAGYFKIQVETSDDDMAREAAAEIVTECGTGS